MKLKLVTLVLTFLTLNSITLQAQNDKAAHTQFKQNKDQIKDRYEEQKKTVQLAYKADLAALKTQTNLTKAQSNEQRKAIQERFEQQKKAQNSN